MNRIPIFVARWPLAFPKRNGVSRLTINLALNIDFARFDATSTQLAGGDEKCVLGELLTCPPRDEFSIGHGAK